MKIGVISDVHNNLPALEAVLAQLASCDRIICCGDIIGIGPYPEETVRRMMRIPGLTAVLGNHDRYLLDGMPDSVPNSEGMDEAEMGMHRWEHARLSQQSVDFLRSLPRRAELEIEGVRIAVLHYCMDDCGRYGEFAPSPSPQTLDAMFAGVDADVVLYGHDHAPWQQQTQRALYIDPGSLGCPGAERDIARAGILTIGEGAATFTPLRVRYDAAQVVSRIDSEAYPSAQDIKRFFFGIDR